MDIFRFYQGYSVNRNNFFAPSLAKKLNRGLVKPKNNVKPIQANTLYRIVTAKGRNRKRRSGSGDDNNVITPETLAFHVNKRKNASTPNPQKHKYSAGIQTGKDSPIIHDHYKKPKYFKQSCDAGIQNESLTSLHFPELHPYIRPIPLIQSNHLPNH